MADRAAKHGGVGTRLTIFARSLVMLGVIAVGVPAALALAARERFGGAAPLHGVPSPTDWSFERIRSSLSDRLTDQTIADIVIRVSLVAAWVAIAVLLVTVVAEVVHMVRHDGLAMPDIRGFGLSQRSARFIASGLLVLVPLFTSPSSAIALDTSAQRPERAVASAVDAPLTARPTAEPTSAPIEAGPPEAPPVAGSVDGLYVVKAGDSVFGIAERMAGPESVGVAAFAEQLVDLNLGRQMPDGRHFNNAAFIDVGWVLELPDIATRPTDAAAIAADGATSDVHVVERGESLWSIADEELGDPTRWPEVYDANEGKTFDDGRSLKDPDLIQPGWELQLPVEAVQPAPTAVEPLADVVPDAPVAESVVPDRVAASLDADSPADAGHETSRATAADVTAPPARRDNVWDEPSASPGQRAAAASAASTVADAAGSADDTDEEGGDDSESPALLLLGSAAMLSAGVLTLLAVRRRQLLRRARPRAALPDPADGPVATERILRAIDVGDRFVRVETAIRAVASPLVGSGHRALVILIGTDGALELRSTGPVDLPAPWEGHGATWHLPASAPLELLTEAAHGIASPCPALVQLGTDAEGRDVYVDLEAVEAIEVGGPGSHADSIVAAVAATLAGSTLAEVTTLVGLGVDDDAFLGHRLYAPVRDPQRAFEAAADAIGSTASMTASTFELRAGGSAGETWEPAVVLAGSAVGTITPPTRRTGLAVVSASPIHGASSRLEPDGDAWILRPAGIRLRPVGLTPDDIGAIAELVTVVEPEPEPELDRRPLDDEHTIAPTHDDAGADLRAGVANADDEVGELGELGEPVGSPAPDHELLVRLLGPVDVVDRAGDSVSFERSKTRELVAWLATHRERSTRSAARTALWELDVRDATFANVVSEARRSLARLVEPPEDEEWVGRTMTDALPLHRLVLTDVDLVRHALDAARVQPPAQAIATLAPAVDLIVGMPFEGTSYLWPDSEGIASNLVLLATTATTELAAHCLSLGDIEGVFAATGRGLCVLPAHEELIGLRMEAHAGAGDHAGIRQEWESYERVINADPWSDGEPAPKLVELRRRLLNPAR